MSLEICFERQMGQKSALGLGGSDGKRVHIPIGCTLWWEWKRMSSISKTGGAFCFDLGGLFLFFALEKKITILSI